MRKSAWNSPPSYFVRVQEHFPSARVTPTLYLLTEPQKMEPEMIIVRKAGFNRRSLFNTQCYVAVSVEVVKFSKVEKSKRNLYPTPIRCRYSSPGIATVSKILSNLK